MGEGCRFTSLPFVLCLKVFEKADERKGTTECEEHFGNKRDPDTGRTEAKEQGYKGKRRKKSSGKEARNRGGREEEEK